MANLQALYDLKERLEYSAIAGTGLLQEDFRLKRAAEGLAPLAAASPVFAKISTSVKALLEASSDERSKQLLDVLSLVDAVAYTQGTTGIAGDMISINTDKNNPFIGKYIHASYAQLQPLIIALTTTGSGRMAIIEECKNNHPEYFGDFRVLPYVIKALGDSYSEIPDLICAILEGQGKSVVPLLKEGFEPDGKKDMVRRAALIWNISGSDENDWYISVLPEAKKEIREVIIKALGESKDNEQLLLDLYNSERGKAKEAVMYSLAKLDTPKAAECWKKEIVKHPDYVNCLEGVNTNVAAQFSAQVMKDFLEKLMAIEDKKYDHNHQSMLMDYESAITGKYSQDMYELWLWIAENILKLETMSFSDHRFLQYNIAESLQISLLRTILWNKCEEVFALARKLGNEKPDYFMGAAFLTDILELSATEVYDKYSPYLLSCISPDKETMEEKRYRLQILQVLNLISWNEENKSYEIEFYNITKSYERNYNIIQNLEFDNRWLSLITDRRLSKKGDVFDVHTKYRISSPVDCILARMINTEDKEMCEIIGKYLYERVLYVGNITEMIPSLLKCGWTQWKGLLVHCVRKKSRIDYYVVRESINQMPLSNAEKIEELKSVQELMNSTTEKTTYNKWVKDYILEMIKDLEEGFEGVKV